MNNINKIQDAILQLEGGAFQKLFDEYLYKKYKFSNIQTLGVQTGTNKPTKGTPDSYVRTDDGKYILINYGTVGKNPEKKIKDDIISCFKNEKLDIPKEKIEKIICGHTSTNIHIEQDDEIKNLTKGIKIELIGIDTISHDLALSYPHIAKDQLGISIDTNQIFDIEDFVKIYDRNNISAPIDCDILHRETELNNICNSVGQNKVTILTGASGIGKTRLAIEACRNLDNNATTVLCVKSNGNLLYEDIRFYTSEPGQYLIFLDDANTVTSLDNVLNTISTLPDNYQISILLTVRIYAKERVIKTASKYSKPNIIEIENFNNDEIEDILKKNLNILNSDYLERISAIANGNIRLAMLAGIGAVKNGYQAINNAEDIFKNYYDKIIYDTNLSKEDIMMLFFTAVAGPVRNNKNQLFYDLKNSYANNISEDVIIEKLCLLELVDWFKNEITKISDQSFGNYILYYVLFDRKWVSIENLISIGFPNYKDKIVYAITTLIEIFTSDELQQYIQTEIKKAWDKAPVEQGMEYLESFHIVDSDKALSIIYKQINQEKKIDFDLHNYDFNQNNNNHNISTKAIKFLGDYKYTEQFDDALDLILLYFSKRPDLIMDFYNVLSNYLFDKHSAQNKYTYESRILDKLWCATENGTNYNNSILYLHIAEYALETKKLLIEPAKNNKSINLIPMPLNFSEELATIRTNIWKNLATLRKNKEYRNLVNDILTKVNYSELNKEDITKFLQSDFNMVYEYIVNKDNPDFFDALIVAQYKKIAQNNKIPTDDRYQISENNHEFQVYKMFTLHFKDKTPKENEELRNNSILEEIRSYTNSDYQKLFASCNHIEKTLKNENQWRFNSGLDYVFQTLEDNCKLYVEAINTYLNEGAPFKLYGPNKIKYLLDHIGYEATLTLIKDKCFDEKDVWLSYIWECLPEENINEKVLNDYEKFILNNLDSTRPIIPTIQTLNRYGKKDQEFKKKVIESIVKHPPFSSAFFGITYNENDIKTILDFFKDNLDVLIDIYINALEKNNYMDYDGKLFYKIFEQQPKIWDKYIKWIQQHIYQEGNEKYIFELIWTVKEYQRYIDDAYEILIENDLFITENLVKLLFSESKNKDILNRKKRWLLNKLHKTSMDIEKCKKLIYVVVVAIPDWKLEFILEFLKENQNVNDFTKLTLFPSMTFWSGSEIPIILEKIDFLQSLKNSLKGIDYLDHKRYLDEIIRNLNSYKEEVEKQEYLANEYYA